MNALLPDAIECPGILRNVPAGMFSAANKISTPAAFEGDSHKKNRQNSRKETYSSYIYSAYLRTAPSTATTAASCMPEDRARDAC